MFHGTKYMSFFIKNYKLLEKYNKIWDKVTKSIRKDVTADQRIMKNI